MRSKLIVVTGGLLSMGLAVGSASPAFAEKNPPRDAYFGETHVHTSWSFDAFIFGNHMTGPDDAYKYAKGETIKHPLGYDVKITTPLDRMGVTDHSEYAGVVRLSNDPSSSISKLPIAKELIVRAPADIQRIYLWLGESMVKMQPIKALVDPQVAGTVWKAITMRPMRRTSPASSRRSVPTSGRPLHAPRTCTATCSSRIVRRCLRCRSARSIRRHPRTCGTGWTASARRATSCSRSRTTPISRTASCIRRRSTSKAGRSTRFGPMRAIATSASPRSSRSRGRRRRIRCCRPTTNSPTMKS